MSIYTEYDEAVQFYFDGIADEIKGRQLNLSAKAYFNEVKGKDAFVGCYANMIGCLLQKSLEKNCVLNSEAVEQALAKTNPPVLCSKQSETKQIQYKALNLLVRTWKEGERLGRVLGMDEEAVCLARKNAGKKDYPLLAEMQKQVKIASQQRLSVWEKIRNLCSLHIR